MYRIGLIINPIAGVGGSVGLKGSDGDAIVAEAKKRGAVPQSGVRALRCLQMLESEKNQLHFIVCPRAMGEEVLANLDYGYSVLPMSPVQSTGSSGPLVENNNEWSALDTEKAVILMLEEKVDLIVFVGGDGTARNVFNALSEKGEVQNQLVLGVPAGVKIHSGVYSVTPDAAAEIIGKLVRGEIVSLVEAEVRDIDEEAFRQGQVKARFYGELSVPAESVCMQQVKNSGQQGSSREQDELALQDIAAYIIELMHKETLYVIGPGSTTKSITDSLGLDGTLLGVDVILNEVLIAKDVMESELYELIQGRSTALIITAIGGQGHILGRGNQQLSPRVLRIIEKKHIWVAATPSKLQALDQRPFLVDSGDPDLDDCLSGFIPVIVGYEDKVIYRVGRGQG
ncbi:MAG: ATP-NAD kinase family protein [Pseudomonadales bacterium]|nr:ATP-NAD kinase family protein [Pseudomonadales bacterium]